MSLLRPTLIVAAASIGARLLGFARDVLFAQAFGTGPVADAFLAAYRFLDVVRRVVGEGGLNPALVPLLIPLRRDEAARFTGAALAAAGLALLAVTAIVELAAGLFIAALAPGLAVEGGALGLAALYTRLSWPLAAGIVLASVVGAALNAGGRFAAAALAPLTTGVLTVTALLILRGTDLAPADRAAWLAAALGLAGALQLAIVVAAARRHDLLRWSSPFRSVALRRFGLTGPVLIAASGAPHLFIVAGTQVASFWPSGVSRLFYADRVAYLVSALVAAIVGAVLLPALSQHHRAGRRETLVSVQNRAMELALLVSVPAATALAALAPSITQVLFQRGAFDAADTQATAEVLIGLAVGVPVTTLGKVVAQTVFARGAAREALAAAAGGLLVTVAGALLLGSLLGFRGLGFGLSAGALAYLGLLVRFLGRAGLWSLDERLRARALRIASASGVMGAALWAAQRSLGAPQDPSELAQLCLGGLALYAAAAWIFGAVRREDLASLGGKKV
jgi:putative peptidoglycan lipid II flippase